MDENKAKSILRDAIEKNGDLYQSTYYNKGYIFWQKEDKVVELDGSFTIEQLEAVIWWMRRKG